KLSIGVKLYDLLCGQSNLGRSGTLTPQAAAQLLPGLATEGLTGAVRYFDGLSSDARLVLDTLRSASLAGATVLNYAAASEPEYVDGEWVCRLLDEETGEAGRVQARVIVNAAGAWADRFPPSRAALRLTKGVHLVIDRSRLAIPEAVVMTDGGRILFAIPWGDRVILGTTDTDYAGPLENPDCTAEDISYVLSIVNRTFPAAAITPADMISAWSGIRPLIADPNGKPSDISRAHQIRETQPGWIDVTGGKLTTYRLMAEQTVDLIRHRLARTSLRACETADHVLLPPGDTAFSGIVPPEVSREAVLHYCHQEWARHLDDVMIRRAGWHNARPDSLAVAERVSQWMAESYGWSAMQLSAEHARYRHMTESVAPQWTPLPVAPD
ncbi:MAG: glpD, partial [Phycisphaerales bacterium]|nr:glpD [Phycisphaerales bacterium]